jgi:hypothetical protein
MFNDDNEEGVFFDIKPNQTVVTTKERVEGLIKYGNLQLFDLLGEYAQQTVHGFQRETLDDLSLYGLHDNHSRDLAVGFLADTLENLLNKLNP